MVGCLMKEGRFKKSLFGAIGFFAVFVGVWLSSSNVMAAANVNIQKTLKEKAVFQGVHRCYDGGAMEPSIEPGNYRNIGSLTGDNASSIEVPLWSGSQGQATGLITSLDFIRGVDDYEVADDNLTCKELFEGDYGDARDILSVTGKNEPNLNNLASVSEFLENMGYHNDGSSANTDWICKQATFTYGAGSGGTTNGVCQNRSTGEWKVVGQPSVVGTRFYIDGGKVCLWSDWHLGVIENCVNTRNRELNTGFLMEVIREACGDDYHCERLGYNNDIEFSSDSSTGYGDYPYEDMTAEYTLLDGAAAGDKAVGYLSGDKYSTMDSLEVTNAEKRILYQEYITQYYDVSVTCGDTDIGLGSVRWYDYSTGEISDCYIQNEVSRSKSNQKVNGIDDNGMYMDRQNGQGMSYQDIIDALKNMEDPDDAELEELGEVATEERDTGDAEAAKDCRNSGAGNSLGWILCPILELMGDAAESFYNNIVEPALQVRTYLFTSDVQSESSIPYTAWATFRDIANMIFAVALLFVIFSQLTGLGIDNYGIKRILPKLIIAVILINLSYLICIICVDLSNILGNGLQSMFNSFGNGLSVEHIRIRDAYNARQGVNYFTISTASNLAVIGLIGGLAFMTGSIWIAAFGPMILLTLIFTAIAIIIALVFLFFFLSVRQGAIILLVVTSPVAMVCYFLPNTKSLYDKWMKLFRALLLVYPIAGLLVGGGNYVSKLMLAAGGAEEGFFLAITAMIMGIVPIFLIPSVLKNAINMLPMFGQMFSGWEGKVKGFSGNVKGAIKGSDPFKYAQKAGQEKANRLLAGLDEKGLRAKKYSGLYKFLAGGDRGMRDRRAQVDQDLLAKERGELWNNDDYIRNRAEYRKTVLGNEKEKMYNEMYDRSDVDAVHDALKNGLKSRNAEMASAAFNSLVKKGALDKIYDSFDALDESDWGSIRGDKSMKRFTDTMITSGIGSIKGYAKYNGDAKFKDWIDGTGTTMNREAGSGANAKGEKIKEEYASYAAYLMNNGGDTALNNVGKDEMNRIAQSAEDIQRKMEQLSGLPQNGGDATKGTDMFAAMMTNAALNSSDTKVKTRAESVIEEGITRNRFGFDNMDLNSDKASRMGGGMAQAIQNGYQGLFKDRVPGLTDAAAKAHAQNYIRSVASGLLDELKASPEMYGRTSGKVIDMLNGRDMR